MGIFSRKSSTVQHEPSMTTQQLADSINGSHDQTPSGPARSVTLTKGSGPATNRVSLEKSAGASVILTKFDKAVVSLSKRDLDGIRGDVYAYIDNSGSMDPDFRHPSKPVQVVAERALGFGLTLDSDGKLPFIPWDSRVHTDRNIELTAENIIGAVDREIVGTVPMGTTNMVALFSDILSKAMSATAPMFVFIFTDGDPNGGTENQVIEKVIELSHYPVWLKVVAIKPVPFMQTLSTLSDNPAYSSRLLVDNLSAVTILDPVGMTDLAFADKMTEELSEWIAAATSKGLLN